jgi:hypothetical protein
MPDFAHDGIGVFTSIPIRREAGVTNGRDASIDAFEFTNRQISATAEIMHTQMPLSTQSSHPHVPRVPLAWLRRWVGVVTALVRTDTMHILSDCAILISSPSEVPMPQD